MTAQDFFDLARCQARRIEPLVRELDALRCARDEVLSWEPRTHGGGSSRGAYADPTASAAQSRIEGLDARVAAKETELEEAQLVVGHALSAIDRVRHALGSKVADAMELYYVDLADTWSDVAYELGCSLRTVERLRESAFRWVDERGIVAAWGAISGKSTIST